MIELLGMMCCNVAVLYSLNVMSVTDVPVAIFSCLIVARFRS